MVRWFGKGTRSVGRQSAEQLAHDYRGAGQSALLGRAREAGFALPERLDAFDVGARAVTWAVLALVWGIRLLLQQRRALQQSAV